MGTSAICARARHCGGMAVAASMVVGMAVAGTAVGVVHSAIKVNSRLS